MGSTTDDRNFDDLAGHFERRIYGGIKGKVRLAVLHRDLRMCLEQLGDPRSLDVLDAGAGLAQLALDLAQDGHRVTVNDLSLQMLSQAQARAQAQGLASQVAWRHGPFQRLAGEGPWDLVLCHALLEWLGEPRKAVELLGSMVRPGGHLSLAFYNRDAQIFRNLVRGNFKRVRSGVVRGEPGGLTPIHPLCPQQVARWLEASHLSVAMTSGIRVFRDYVGAPAGGNLDEEEVVRMELACSNQEPFWRLGRYIHFLCRKD